MTRTEHLLTILAEECSEVAQRVSKALRFGPQEIQPGQDLTNAERIVLEMLDLTAAFEMLVQAGLVPPSTDDRVAKYVAAKKTKVEKFLAYSKECGTLNEETDRG